MANAKPSTVDQAEIAHFGAEADRWWDTAGIARWIHTINPVRIDYTTSTIARLRGQRSDGRLDGVRLLDVGCGAGVLSEPLARCGATVVGIDPSASLIDVARRHAAAQGVAVDYRCTAPEALVDAGERFDVVVAYDVAEHVPDSTLFLQVCARLLKADGILLVSTMNRTIRSFVQAIALGEYVLRFLPRGSHQWSRFIKPAEMAATLRDTGLQMTDLRGLTMNLRTRRMEMSGNTAVTYFAAFKRDWRDSATTAARMKKAASRDAAFL